jgi:hypothetical protein
MTIDEFNELKPGDRIRNADGAEAEVVDVNMSGVRITWGSGPVTFPLYRASTIWFGLDVVKPEGPDAS